MATHSSVLAWEIPWTEEPSGLQSTGLQSQTRLTHTHQTAWILFLDPLLDLDLGSSVSENTLLSGVHSVFCICFLSPPPHFSLGGLGHMHTQVFSQAKAKVQRGGICSQITHREGCPDR